MSCYRRSLATGATFFFTVNLADRSSRLRFKGIHRLRRACDIARLRHPVPTLAYCVLPDHLHTVWEVPEHHADFGLRWGVTQRLFSSGRAPATVRSTSKIVKREKGLWQRRCWEHQIRDDTDLRRHADDILSLP
jgi:putative transposase